MKRFSILAVSALVFILFLGSSVTFAQATFKIPVKFEVNGKMEPAGDYTFEVKEEGKIALKRKPDGDEILVAYSGRLDTPEIPSENPQIVLDMVGNFAPSYTEYITDHILAELWLPGEKGYLILTTEGAHEHKIVEGEAVKKEARNPGSAIFKD